MSKVDYTIMRDSQDLYGNDYEKEIELEVDYDVSKGSKGMRDNFGVPLEPDEDPEITINSTIDQETGADIELTAYEMEALEEYIYEILADREDDDYEE